MENLNLSLSATTLINDINNCLNKVRVDDMMNMFLHIYNEADIKILDKVTMSSSKDISTIKRDIEKKLDNIKFMKQLDEFYLTFENPDEGRLLLDDEVADNKAYILDNNLYKETKKIKKTISIVLGMLKKEITKSSDINFNF